MTGPVGLPALGLTLLGVVLLVATAWAAGRLALRALPASEGRPPGLAVGTGLVLCSQLAFWLALLGWLRPASLLAAAAAIHLAGLGEWRRLSRRLRASTPGQRTPPWPLLVLGGVIVGSCLLLALYPPTGFDETLYHLPMARAFATSGGLPFLPDLRYPAFPALGEAMSAALWLLGGEVATHAVPFLAVVSCAVLLLEREPTHRGAGWVAAALFAGSPVVVYMAGSGYVEPLLALCATIALLALERWSAGGGAFWCGLAGFAAGSAAATKYLGLLVLAYAAIHVCVLAWRRRRPGLVLFLLAGAIAVLPTYARLWALTGSPLFPFLPGLFGSSPWAADEYLGPRGVERLRAAMVAPWDLVFRRERLGWMPPFTPALPLLVPLLGWGVARVPACRRWALLPIVQLASPPLAAHYLVMSLPALAVAGGEAAAALVARWRLGRSWLAAAAVMLLLPGPLYAAYWWWRWGPPPPSATARAEYLEARLPMYGALRALERSAPRGYVAYSVGGEHLLYFANGRWLGDATGPASFTRVLPSPPDPQRLASRLDRLGAGYLVVAAGARPMVFPSAEPTWRPWFAPLHADAAGQVYELRARTR